MKDLMIIVLMFVIIIFGTILSLQVDNLTKENENLKKEKYECKIELDKYRDKYLNLVIRSD